MAYEYITDSNGRKFRRYNFIETTDLPVYDYRDANIDMLIKTQVCKLQFVFRQYLSFQNNYFVQEHL